MAEAGVSWSAKICRRRRRNLCDCSVNEPNRNRKFEYMCILRYVYPCTAAASISHARTLSLSLFANLAFYRNSASPLVPSDEGMERADDKVDLPCNKDRPLYSAGSSDHVAVTGDRD